MTIQTIDELLDFIETNYEKLTDKHYQLLVTKCMHLYEFEKPDTKEKTIDRLLDLHAFTQNYKSVTEMPLFLDED